MNSYDKRRNRRFDISEYVKDNYFKDIKLEINTDIIYVPKLIDISVTGLGLALEESDSINLNEFDRKRDYFINLHFSDKEILAEVKKIWSIITVDAGERILKGGFFFSIISPEDKLNLAKYLNSLRQ